MTPTATLSPLVIRTDADNRIGVGHVMRCLALAQAWRRQGGEVVFISRIASEALKARISDEGFRLINCSSSHPDRQDREFTLSWLAENASGRPGWVVLDGYHFDGAYQRRLQLAGYRLLMIDDTAHLPAYHSDILLNQNLYAQELDYPVSADILKLLGRRYLLLREEFLNARLPDVQVATAARRILVSMGGADPDNATQKIIDALDCAGIEDMTVKVVVGPASLNGPNLARRIKDLAGRYELIPNATDMAGHMAWADFAIVGAGTTSWELIYLGTPFAAVVLADNQEGVAASLAGFGAAVTLGRLKDWKKNQLAVRLREWLDDSFLRQRLRRQGRQMVDGRGADRVVRAMRYYDFSFRPVQNDDCEIIFKWANDPAIRQASFHPAPIPWSEHQQWFQDKLQNRFCVFYLITDLEDSPLGQVRFDLVKRSAAVISISLGQEMRGCGLGSRVIRQACLKVAEARGIKQVQALIRKEHSVSIESFGAAGFTPIIDTRHKGFKTTVMQWRLE